MRPASCLSVKCKPSNLPQACNFIKKRLWHRCSPVNFAKFLRTPFLQNSSGRLLVEAHSKLSQTSKMEVFTKIVNSCLLFSQKAPFQIFDWVLNTPLESITSLSFGSHISLNYIQSALSVYIISNLHLRQSKSNKVIEYIAISSKLVTYTWEQPWDLVWVKWKWTGDVQISM